MILAAVLEFEREPGSGRLDSRRGCRLQSPPAAITSQAGSRSIRDGVPVK